MGSRLKSPAIDRNRIVEDRQGDPDQLDLDLRVESRACRELDRTKSPPRGGETPGRGAHPFLMTVMFTGALSVMASPAWAAGAGATMPWDGPLQALVNNLTGTTARALVLLAVVGAGLLWAFTRNEEGLKKLGQITFGGAIALGAATLMASLGFAGATF
jgi:type IV secretion system protein VirB2